MMARRAALLLLLLACASAPLCAADGAPTVGMEGRLVVALPGPQLESKPVDPKAPLILRIASAHPEGEQTRYDLRYIGLEPGAHDLRKYLMRIDGSPAADLPALTVRVEGLLPARHSGHLIEEDPAALPSLSGYTVALIAIGAIWFIAFVVLLWRRPAKKAAMTTAAPTVAPTLADRLRPLIEAAVNGTLSKDGQAALERMLLAHWRERLGVTDDSLAIALPKIRAHPEAGEVLRTLEAWLHRPPQAAKVDVSALLAPYASVPAPTAEARAS